MTSVLTSASGVVLEIWLGAFSAHPFSYLSPHISATAVSPQVSAVVGPLEDACKYFQTISDSFNDMPCT